MYRSVIEISGQKADNDLIHKALAPDMESTDRAKISMSSGKTLKIDIQAKDITSLRAVINTVLRQIKLIEDVTKIGDNNDTTK
ncbi:MAG: CTAG/PCC1 family protein [Candidatus Aenigmarchaeota archaeon]|nr:CTAG/PCC1 family protein [Candidatus Aenigmarchaeota archaeon]